MVLFIIHFENVRRAVWIGGSKALEFDANEQVVRVGQRPLEDVVCL